MKLYRIVLIEADAAGKFAPIPSDGVVEIIELERTPEQIAKIFQAAAKKADANFTRSIGKAAKATAQGIVL